MSLQTEEEVLSTLLQWSQEGRLSQATLAPDGSSLSLDGVTVPNIPLTITTASPSNDDSNNKSSCQYSMTSIYLQIRDPDQKVVDYRNACKQYGVNDPVKTLDKALVLGYFFALDSTNKSVPEQESTAGTTTADGAETTAATATATAADLADLSQPGSVVPEDGVREKKKHSDRHKKERKEKHKRDKEKHKHRKKRSHEDKHGKDKHVQKKKPKIVTNEELFSNLNVVVDKRQQPMAAASTIAAANDIESITKALSADGFFVTPELLQANIEKAQLILSNEIPMGNSASILRAANPRRNLSRVLELFQETLPAPPPPPPSGSSKRHGKPGNSSSSRPPPPPVPKNLPKTYLKDKKPVIVVPKGMTAPITLVNAHAFFAQAKFIPRQVMMQQTSRQRAPATNFTRPYKGVPLEYEIMDNPKKLGPDPKEWERIVAVIVLGQPWQFKDWLGKFSDPTYLFAHSFGFFICMEGDKIPAEISKWSVNLAKLNRDKRGLDSVTFASFWNGLDEFMSVNKRELLPQNLH